MSSLIKVNVAMSCIPKSMGTNITVSNSRGREQFDGNNRKKGKKILELSDEEEEEMKEEEKDVSNSKNDHSKLIK